MAMTGSDWNPNNWSYQTSDRCLSAPANFGGISHLVRSPKAH